MKSLMINTNKKSYKILIEKDLFSQTHKILKEHNFKKIGLLVDENVNEIYKQQIEDVFGSIEHKKIVIDSGEESKSFDNYQEILETLIDYGLNRSDLIITLGGGVVGDLGGFVASTLYRGVDYIQIPTTLLSQIDSSIGGKVAINSDQGKNLIGSFYHPSQVIIDPKFLDTLDDEDVKSGLGELIKYAAIKDIYLFNQLEMYINEEELFDNIEEVIYKALEIKKHLVERDEYDKNLRMLLNFGHTIGHGLEKGYKFENIKHGEAVAIGMAMITKITEAKEITEKGSHKRLVKLLDKFGIRHHLIDFELKDLLQYIKVDKKVIDDKLHLIVLKELGQADIMPIHVENISSFLGVQDES